MSGSSNGNAAEGSTLLRNAQELVRSLAGVLAVEVVPDGCGRLGSIHVVATDAFGADEVRWNVRSALLARFGISLEPGAIHVRCVPAPPRVARAAMDGAQRAAPVDAPPPASTLAERAALRMGPLPRPEPRPGLQGFELERRHPNRVHCRVVLTLGDHAYTGEAEALDTEDARLEAAARATLHALRAAAGGSADTIELEGARETTIAGQSYVVAAARLFHGRSVRRLAGAAAVETSPEYTAALAILQATNRWLGGRLWADTPVSAI